MERRWKILVEYAVAMEIHVSLVQKIVQEFVMEFW
jgi:hypothetical protein